MNEKNTQTAGIEEIVVVAPKAKRSTAKFRWMRAPEDGEIYGTLYYRNQAVQGTDGWYRTESVSDAAQRAKFKAAESVLVDIDEMLERVAGL